MYCEERSGLGNKGFFRIGSKDGSTEFVNQFLRAGSIGVQEDARDFILEANLTLGGLAESGGDLVEKNRMNSVVDGEVKIRMGH